MVPRLQHFYNIEKNCIIIEYNKVLFCWYSSQQPKNLILSLSFPQTANCQSAVSIYREYNIRRCPWASCCLSSWLSLSLCLSLTHSHLWKFLVHYIIQGMPPCASLALIHSLNFQIYRFSRNNQTHWCGWGHGLTVPERQRGHQPPSTSADSKEHPFHFC